MACWLGSCAVGVGKEPHLMCEPKLPPFARGKTRPPFKARRPL